MQCVYIGEAVDTACLCSRFAPPPHAPTRIHTHPYTNEEKSAVRGREHLSPRAHQEGGRGRERDLIDNTLFGDGKDLGMCQGPVFGIAYLWLVCLTVFASRLLDLFQFEIEMIESTVDE